MLILPRFKANQTTVHFNRRWQEFVPPSSTSTRASHSAEPRQDAHRTILVRDKLDRHGRRFAVLTQRFGRLDDDDDDARRDQRYDTVKWSDLDIIFINVVIIFDVAQSDLVCYSFLVYHQTHASLLSVFVFPPSSHPRDFTICLLAQTVRRHVTIMQRGQLHTIPSRPVQPGCRLI